MLANSIENTDDRSSNSLKSSKLSNLDELGQDRKATDQVRLVKFIQNQVTAYDEFEYPVGNQRTMIENYPHDERWQYPSKGYDQANSYNQAHGK